MLRHANPDSDPAARRDWGEGVVKEHIQVAVAGGPLAALLPSRPYRQLDASGAYPYDVQVTDDPAAAISRRTRCVLVVCAGSFRRSPTAEENPAYTDSLDRIELAVRAYLASLSSNNDQSHG